MFRCVCLLLFFIQLHAKPCIGISTATNYVGDREVAWRVKIAAERLGWTVILDENEGRDIQTMKNLDWVICLLPNNPFLNPYCANYVSVFHPFWFLDAERRLLPFYEQFNGFLLTVNDRETIANSLHSKRKEFHFIPFYPSIYYIPYQELDFKELMIMIPVWGNRLTEPKFRTLFNLLSKSGHAKFYGWIKDENIISEGYMGTIPFDGVSVIDRLQKHGISLVLHSDVHIAEAIPSSRIFEAAAASTVIISDENPFVRKHFGDAVFYINTELSSEEIFDQIQHHLMTIIQSPKTAKEMAKRAHEIFCKNFEMCHQLLQLEAMHRQVKFKKKRNVHW